MNNECSNLDHQAGELSYSRRWSVGGTAENGPTPLPATDTHTIVSAPDYEAVTTHVLVEGDHCIESDAVFGVKNSLVAAPDGKHVDRPHYAVRYDFGLNPAG
jgi:hypothetical protein